MVYISEWPPFWKELLILLNVCSLCNLYICNFGCFPFWFLSQDCVSDTLVPGHCLPFTLLSSRELH